ncbi:MAG: nickel pincer cofactor biosynthesis protein LarC [Chloroflexota bacterium]
MRTAYFDCFAGASGDMILGALLDAGLDINVLKEQLGLLPLNGWDLDVEQVMRSGLRASKVNVRTNTAVRLAHRSDVEEIIRDSGLSERVKTVSMSIFDRLFEAEARVHGSTPDKVHLHEMGDLDTIIDIVGAVVGLESLGVDAVYVSPLPTGSGTITTQHGLLPLPGPAVMELLRGAPLRRLDIEAELVTPTGAAILTTLAQGYGMHSTMRITASGYGAGTRELPFANVLRVMIGESANVQDSRTIGDMEPVEGIYTEYVTVLETQIDDMPAEWYGYLMPTLLDAGALDVYFTPVQMKKNRPGTLLTVICKPDDANRLSLLVLGESSTLGVRQYNAQRLSLPRTVGTVQTRFGPIQVKVATLPGGKERIAPEYESCLQAAQAHGVALWEVYRAALQDGGTA